MRFADSNIFLYAFLKPRKPPPKDVRRMKQRAIAILNAIKEGKEDAVTSVVHLSEIANIVEEASDAVTAGKLLQALLANPHIRVVDVNRGTYEFAVNKGLDLDISPNDALAYAIMQKEGINEIYSFDRDFDKIAEIRRLA